MTIVHHDRVDRCTSLTSPSALQVQRADEDCSRSCGGDSTMTCGGGDANSVYQITDQSKPWEAAQYSGVANGPKNPIYIGGHAYVNRRGEHGGSFLGNVANLGLFDRDISEVEVDCLFRQGEKKIGSCRKPDDMWNQVFWNSFTDGTLDSYATDRTAPWPGVMLSDGVVVADQVGLDFTGGLQAFVDMTDKVYSDQGR